MSYPIVFETKIAELSDGRIIHFDRSGCNNDNCGRSRSEFTGKLYTREDFIQKANNYKKNSKPYKESDNFDMKIGSRYATIYDYGEHLLRMLRKAVDYKTFVTDRRVTAMYCKSIELIEPEHKTLTLKEFDKVYHELLRSDKIFRYSRVMDFPDTKDEELIVGLLEKDIPIEFYIGKSHK